MVGSLDIIIKNRQTNRIQYIATEKIRDIIYKLHPPPENQITFFNDIEIDRFSSFLQD